MIVEVFRSHICTQMGSNIDQNRRKADTRAALNERETSLNPMMRMEQFLSWDQFITESSKVLSGARFGKRSLRLVQANSRSPSPRNNRKRHRRFQSNFIEDSVRYPTLTF